MEATEILGLVLTLLVMLIGLAGAVLPVLPGTPLVFAAALGHKLHFGELGASWLVIILLGLLAAFSLLVDFLATTFGAKKLGATWRGMVGAGIGAVLGIFWPLLGLLLFPLLGATLAEMIGGREWREAGKAGIGAALGVVAGTLGKVACCLGMIGLFVLNVLWTRMGAGPSP
jgi:uncharacterized protein YqgC (DUF456 family)